VTVSGCLRLSDTQGTASMLICSLYRAGRSHVILISVDHEDCSAADDISLFDPDLLPNMLDQVRATGRESGFEITTQALDPAEFRWQVEQALDARAVHDVDDLDGEPPGPSADGDGPGYPALAVLVRARMRALPVPGRPAPPHGSQGADQIRRDALQTLARPAGTASAASGAVRPPKPRRGTEAYTLPARRATRDQPAPVYQIKVGLRGARPPIWRRLEVPADIRLGRLHAVIQVAFGWQDYHLLVFETPYGRFGTTDADLGHRAEAGVTLEQAAPAMGSQLRYTYDFGDDWEHDTWWRRS